MRVITFDGGGVLGVGPARMLEQWERETGRHAATMATSWAGTSTGSILAAGLAFGFSASDITDLYLKQAKRIFRERPWYARINSHRYYGDGLRDVLQEVFGRRRMGDSVRGLLIPAADFRGTPKDGITAFFTPASHPEMLVAEAVRRSCSAPTYFPPVEGRWADGGLFANNPSMAMITHLAAAGFPVARLSLLSFATSGKHWDPVDLAKKGTLATLQPMLQFVLSASTARVVHRYCETLGLSWYQRLAPDVVAPELDDLKAMPRWMDVWDAMWEVQGRLAMANFNRTPILSDTDGDWSRRLLS